MADLICISLQTMQQVPTPEATVLCLGNFDGVHLAHRQLMKAACDMRDQLPTPAASGVFCFQIPSSNYLFADPPAQLCSLEQKLHRFRDCGIEYAFLVDFPSVKELSPEEFVSEILLKKCHCRGAVCGFNYRFGKYGAGMPLQLKALLGHPVEICSEVFLEGETVSSTRIRRLLAEGRIEQANRLLTVPYGITATVLHGKALGRQWGFPTVNQQFPQGVQIPKHGVYLSVCTVDGVSYGGVSNIGSRPTVENKAAVNCETYLLDFSGDLYGKELTVSFLKFIRPEQHFDSVAELKAQIQADVTTAKGYFQADYVQKT